MANAKVGSSWDGQGIKIKGLGTDWGQVLFGTWVEIGSLSDRRSKERPGRSKDEKQVTRNILVFGALWERAEEVKRLKD
ncbi:MAG: hypothetical protein K8R73_03065 [Clostridiales bacterium]|nr:hypothetical protein [Clostridiales bacterium]